MTLRIATAASLALFTIACADEPASSVDELSERAESLSDLGGISHSEVPDGAAPEEEAVIVHDDVPRLIQTLMQDLYEAEEDCVPGATILGSFDNESVTGKALDTRWLTVATISAELDDTGLWAGQWTGVSEPDYDENGDLVVEPETGEIDGEVDATDATFMGTIHMSEGFSMEIDGYWVYETETSGFFFGVAADCV